VEPFAIEILVDHGNPAAHGSRLQRLERNAQDQMVAAAPAAQRVECVDAQRAIRRLVFTERIRAAEAILVWVGRHHAISNWQSIQKGPREKPAGSAP
jgi:hypothetical protein